MRAVPNSGLSDFVSSLFINFEILGAATDSTFSTWADPPDLSAVSKEVGLMVMHFFLSLLLTVAKAFPAYIGRTKRSSPSILIISLT